MKDYGKIFHLALVVGCTVIVTGCFTRNRLAEAVKSDPSFLTTKAALEYFDNALHKGQVPGVKPDETKDLNFGVDSLPENQDGIKYPKSIKIYLEKPNEPHSIYWYTVQKPSESVSWKVIDAWKGERKGTNWVHLFP